MIIIDFKEREKQNMAESPPKDPPEKEMASQYSKIFHKDEDKPMHPSMTQEKRERLLEDIHGVADIRQEEPSFVATCLETLEKEIEKIDGNKRTGYDLAKKKDNQFVCSKDFRIMFLRALGYAPDKAANRIMNHFNVKLELFGENKLVQDITYDDLSSDDQETVCTGSHQYLGGKDAMERTITFVFPSLVKAKSLHSFMRYQWYHYMVALKEESTQKYGFVVIMVGHFQTVQYDDWGMTAQCKLGLALPVRPVAMHACYLNQNVPSHARALKERLQKRFQLRFRYHKEETATACLNSLQSFGLGPENIPLNHDGQIDTKLYLKVLEERKIRERKLRQLESMPNNSNNSRKNSSCLERNNIDTNTQSSKGVSDGMVPSCKDVLLGRGLRHSGNSILDKLIDGEILSYKKATTIFDKTCITWTIVRHIQASGGRFLKRDAKNRKWFVVDDMVARETFSARFKNRIRAYHFAKKLSANTNKVGTTFAQPRLQQQQQQQQQQVQLRQLQQQLQPLEVQQNLQSRIRFLQKTEFDSYLQG